MKDLVGRCCRKCWRLPMAVVALTATTMIVTGVIVATQFSDVWNDPPELPSSDLVQYKNGGDLPQQYVCVRWRNMIDTGARDSFENRHFKYVIVDADDHWLLVKMPVGFGPARGFGYLKPLPAGTNDRIVVPMEMNDAQFQGRILPFGLDTTAPDPRLLGQVLIFLIIAPCGWVVANIGIKLIGWKLFPRWHPVKAELMRHGDLKAITDQINAEAEKATLEDFGPIVVTDSWIMRRPELELLRFGVWCVFYWPWMYHFWIAPLDEIVWCHFVRYNIDMGVIRTKSGETRQVFLPRRWLEEAFAIIVRKSRWILTEYDRHYEVLWGRNRDRFLEIIEMRKRQYEDDPFSLSPDDDVAFRGEMDGNETSIQKPDSMPNWQKFKSDS